MKLGVCWYPEQWPQAMWAPDAARMRQMGLSRVRIAEFAWSRMEPEPGRFDWAWLDAAIETLHAQGLGVILCTPTATPPRWLVDAHPEILPVDREGRVRGFGSRRHYDFSSPLYRQESRRITRALAERYGAHPAVVAWQTDNEYGCHDTVLTWSPAALEAFRAWLQRRYGAIEALNAAWGAAFWSQEYRSFDEIGLPNLTVTEANPAHRLDFQRFSASQVRAFDAEQVAILRELSPGRDITHNFMGFFADLDPVEVAADLDVAAWDSYPLGFTEQSWLPAEDKLRWARTGHPDVAAFHHDLYRRAGRGRLWILEQQPGPVNWARFNPAPLPGMVRAWTWQAFAHGAELVSYFRWRQARSGQEQMHAGLHRPDDSLDLGGEEAGQVAREIAAVGPLDPRAPAPAALVFDMEAEWITRIQPQGAGVWALRLAFEAYGALRRAGLDVDVVASGDRLDAYRLVVVPCLPHVREALVEALKSTQAVCLFGPRTGSKTADFQVPADLPPGPLRELLPIRVLRVESLRPGLASDVVVGNETLAAGAWREDVEGEGKVRAAFADGGGLAWLACGRFHYLATCPSAALWDRLVAELADEAGVETTPLHQGLRLSRRGGLVFAVNHGPEPCEAPAPAGAAFVLGERRLPAAGVAAWREG